MAEAADSLANKATAKENMIERLIQTEAHFKHQQRGEPDLTPGQKSDIALAILDKSSVLFLERFSKYLTLEDLQYFEGEREDYGVAFYLEEIERRCKDTKHNTVKNRRYQALQELVAGGEYFSEEEMKWRDPLLFDQMVGQYLDESEREERAEAEIDRSDLKFSTILLKHMDTQATKQFYDVLKEREEEQLEESESESSDEDEVEDSSSGQFHFQEDQTENEKMMEIERNQMRGEFLRIMQERFLAGDDKNFDYSKVDSNTDYDSLDILGHDAEEKYFDNEEEEELPANTSQCEDDAPVEAENNNAYDNVTQRLAGVGLHSSASGCNDRQNSADRMEHQMYDDGTSCPVTNMLHDGIS
ncbi:coiled-coil domain-containing protein 97-like [Plakobranchus ocellatus]|uniref:Coiled-coil domain-containing protein 97-like n=1 Tax=Plakobranchus ocellatus TaxID=259542 RepID=A0AAV3YLD8_9GAST|nr:coiled-coil domain-containing protein 97-like [Plakobranchus ocellatus]